MLHGLTLPKYSEVKHFDGQGNFAVSRYYHFPFRFFYRKKLKMMIAMLDKGRVYRNILDFGCGRAEIFREELCKHATSVTCVEHKEEVEPRSKFDVIMCGSVLEFCHLPTTIPVLREITAPRGILVVASPMKNWLTNLYFKLIGDKKNRNSHKEIKSQVSKYFFVVEEKNWLGLYFCLRGYRR